MGDRLMWDQQALDELFKSPQGPIGKELLRIGTRIERGAKRRCPVDTGRLRASVNHDLEVDARGLVVKVGTDVDYAGYVEFGTQHTRAQPFLIPALISEVGP